MLKNLPFGLSFVVKTVSEHGATKQMYCLNHLTDKCWLLSSVLLTTLAGAVSGRERLCIPWGWGGSTPLIGLTEQGMFFGGSES